METGKLKQRISGFNLPEVLVEVEYNRLKKDKIIKRIWNLDHTVWSDNPEEISNRLGWLHSHRIMSDSLLKIYDFVKQVRDEGYTRVLLLGMGGSSLAPEVFQTVFGFQNGFPDLDILDSTDPGAVIEKEQKNKASKTLFIVSTKSGGTVETTSLMKYFYNITAASAGKQNAGEHFIAITDPGSGLEETARKLSFRKIFLNDPNIGGRYSALSYFGLVPAGLAGINLGLLLQKAENMSFNAQVIDCSTGTENTSAWLGSALGALAKNGQDKITFILSPAIRPFGAWIEQLLAESTGKKGKGLLPVYGETLFEPDVYANDRLFIYFRLTGDTVNDKNINMLIAAGHPVIQLNLNDQYDLGSEFFRWMMATAVAGWSLGINPFDQPNVESSKMLTRKLVSEYQDKGKLPQSSPDLKVDDIEVFSGQSADNLQQVWSNFKMAVKSGDKKGQGRSYIAIQAYLKPNSQNDRALQDLRDIIQTSLRVAVTVGYGPRYLHSTGQLHKGDAGNGLFIQLTAEISGDIPIPDHPGDQRSSISFGMLKNAQALGDRQALTAAGRKVLGFHFHGDIKNSIKRLSDAIEGF
jgi:glucose-6-phosphate isomerase